MHVKDVKGRSGIPFSHFPHICAQFFKNLSKTRDQVQLHLRQQAQAQLEEHQRAQGRPVPERDLFHKSGLQFLGTLRTMVTKIAVSRVAAKWDPLVGREPCDSASAV